ncbi:helix-turn-helix transcriptional regulator [bacterium]|nr:helix-turn-helix transcriptional regulator [bacterium]
MLTYDKELMGKKIKVARKEKGYTQEYLSELVGISNRTLNLMEKGKSGMTIETLIKFCNALNVSPNYVLSYKSNIGDKENLLDRFTPDQQRIVKEFIDTFEKLSDTIYKNE